MFEQFLGATLCVSDCSTFVMATITCWPMDLSKPIPIPASTTDLLRWLKHAEKQNFPRTEALDFDSELAKRNTKVILIIDEAALPAPQALIAYSVFSRNKRLMLLHKVCVLEAHRRKGIARGMLELQISRLRSQGCRSLQLWVDEKRVPARCLYASLGFRAVRSWEDYYAPGRTGILMVLSLCFLSGQGERI